MPLSIQSRLKLSRAARRTKQKRKRGREIKQKRMASKEDLLKRADRAAVRKVKQMVAGDKGKNYKDLSAGEKKTIEQRVKKKANVIKRIAKKMRPEIKKKERERLQRFRQRKNEDVEHLIDEIVQEAEAVQSTKDRHRREKEQNKRERDAELDRARLRDARTKNRDTKVEKKLESIADANDIDINIIDEVFQRGLDDWTGQDQHTPEQNAFARVNSFVSGGFAFEMDSDLQEQSKPYQNKAMEKTLRAISSLGSKTNRRSDSKCRELCQTAELMSAGKIDMDPEKLKSKIEIQIDRETKRAQKAARGKTGASMTAHKVASQNAKSLQNVLKFFETDDAGEWGKDELRRKYSADTPGQTSDINDMFGDYLDSVEEELSIDDFDTKNLSEASIDKLMKAFKKWNRDLSTTSDMKERRRKKKDILQQVSREIEQDFAGMRENEDLEERNLLRIARQAIKRTSKPKVFLKALDDYKNRVQDSSKESASYVASKIAREYNLNPREFVDFIKRQVAKGAIPTNLLAHYDPEEEEK